MPISNRDDFDITWDTVKRDSAGAIRAFCAVSYAFDDPKPSLYSSTVEHLVHHTLRSGVLCICRIWDENSRSIGDLIEALSDGFLDARLRPGIARRVEFLSLLEPENEIDRRLISSFDSSLDDQVVISKVINELKFEYESLRDDPERIKLVEHRNKFLGHSTGVRPSEKNSSDYAKAQAVLLQTLYLVDALEWLFENNRTFVANYNVEIDSAKIDWAANRLIK